MYLGSRTASSRIHLAVKPAMEGLDEGAPLERPLLRKRRVIRIQDVQHPWVEGLHDAQRISGDDLIILRRPAGLAHMLSAGHVQYASASGAGVRLRLS